MRLFAAGVALFLYGCFAPPGCDEDNSHPTPIHDFAVSQDLETAPPCIALCNGQCSDLTTDPENCGACGVVCPSGKCELTDGGVPQCSCVPGDGGTPGCGFALEPTCSQGGHCTCGGNEEGVCQAPWASDCKDGACLCGNQGACSPSSADHCDPAQNPSCRCGVESACTGNQVDHCDPSTNPPSCRCGNSPACTGGDSCCTLDVTGANCCGGAKHYCCLDGCCDHPCLVFGFCAE